MSKDYDKDSDSWFTHFGKTECKDSRELRNVDVIVDFDRNANIVGLEIQGFRKALIESQKLIDKIFKSVKEKKE